MCQPLIYLIEKVNMIIQQYKNSRLDQLERYEAERNKNGKNNKVVNVMSDYNKQSHEIDELYRAFSKLTKCIMIARTALLTGNENSAILHYSEAALVFKEQKNYVNLGICYNNIGCLHLRMRDFAKAIRYYEEAIRT